MLLARTWSVFLVATVVATLAVGCDTNGDRRDATPDTDAAGDVQADTPSTAECQTATECDDHVYCNGEERCVGSQCVAGTVPCNDNASCTTDRCDEAARACVHTPDDAVCNDPDRCNGTERCAPTAPNALPGTGCTPVRAENVIDCDDGNNCTLDACDRGVGCVHAPRDLDGDGHVDRACTLDGTPSGPHGDDCNDGDATINPDAPEVCTDGRDNNCDGATDLGNSALCLPSNDTCATATVLPGPGVYTGSTVDLHSDYEPSCSRPGNAMLDAVYEFTTTEPRDLTASVSGGSEGLNLALLDTCAPYHELRCTSGAFGRSSSVRVRELPAGTYHLVVQNAGFSSPVFRLALRLDPLTPIPLDDACPAHAADAAIELADGELHTATFAGLTDDYTLGCNTFSGPMVDAVYRLTLTEPADVDIRAVVPSTPGRFDPLYISLRDWPCSTAASERQCAVGFDPTSGTLRQRSLPAGTYWVVVESSEPSVVVQATLTTPPATRAPDDACPASSTAPVVDLNDGLPHTAVFAGLDDDYTLACFGLGRPVPDAVYRLTLAAASDVQITAVPPPGLFGTTTLVLRAGACSGAASVERRCLVDGSPLGAAVVERGLPAGTYWVIVENSAAPAVVVTAHVRPL